MIKGLVSIITPCYNSAEYIAQTIESVLTQTYQNWEMIIVDDCSIDSSVEIISLYQKSDYRVKLYQTEACSGSPVEPRNIGIEKASGQYIAFLDSDDVWLSDKLENQIKQFDSKDIGIVYSNYEKMSESGIRKNRFIKSPPMATYLQLLNGNCIPCLTAIYDVSIVGKVFFSRQFRHEDYVLWLTILHARCIAKNTNTIEALYRVKKKSVSANKLVALSWQWNIYRNFLKLTFFRSIHYFCFYAIKAFLKYLK
jgi:glycosyltransferase involved in cell wall biosynthesis